MKHSCSVKFQPWNLDHSELHPGDSLDSDVMPPRIGNVDIVRYDRGSPLRQAGI